ncbi:MAG: Gfo/Idh/MocA family oxidoreductase [Flavobacteriales bacterium]|nr:Gfo/Idh/MocA family oxidoreductase [Flavobacteriales bacterium]
MKNTLRICVVGLGRAGNFHLTSIERIDGLELHSVVDTDAALAQREGEARGCKWSTELTELLADDDLNAVIVASPTDAHFQYICDALNAGKHVFTEKPVGHTVEEINTCFELAAKYGKALHLGFQRRFDRNFMALKRRLPELGDARIVKASSRDNPRPSYDYLKISGNIFHDMLIHDFDMLMFLFGAKKPETVFAAGHAYDETIASFNDFDTVMVSIKYSDGMVCSIDTSRIAAYGYDQRIEVFGKKGMATVENERNNSVNLYTENGASHEPFNYSFPQRYKDAYYEEMIQFKDGIRNGILTNVAQAESVLSHQLADAALESIQTGTVVQFKEFVKSNSRL